jgi:hypothetical protein
MLANINRCMWAPHFYNGVSPVKDGDGLLVLEPYLMTDGLRGKRLTNFHSLFVVVTVTHNVYWIPRSWDGVATLGFDFDGMILLDPDISEDPRRAWSAGEYLNPGFGAVVPMMSAPRFHNNVTQGKDLDGALQPDPIDAPSDRKPWANIENHPVTGIPSALTVVKAASLFPEAEDILDMDPKSP